MPTSSHLFRGQKMWLCRGGAGQEGTGTLIIPRCLSEGHSPCKSHLSPKKRRYFLYSDV